MEKISIKKRTNIACWKINCDGACPNTVIESEEGITLVVYVENERKITYKRSVTLNGLVNPGKDTKLIGGWKPYTSCEIYAIDMGTEFVSECGFAGADAISCHDPELDVEAKVVCFGEYSYVIDDFFSFIRALPMGDKEEFSKNNVRDFLRSITAGTARSYISSKIAGRDFTSCQALIGEFEEDIKEQLNKSFDSKGITVNSIRLTIDYEPAHKAAREALKGAKVGVKIKGVVNDGRRDDISVAKAASEVDIGIIKAVKGGDNHDKKEHHKEEKNGVKVFCSRCGEPNNSDSNYCKKCGEKLRK